MHGTEARRLKYLPRVSESGRSEFNSPNYCSLFIAVSLNVGLVIERSSVGWEEGHRPVPAPLEYATVSCLCFVIELQPAATWWDSKTVYNNSNNNNKDLLRR